MATHAAQGATYSCYFNPLTQKHVENYEESWVYIKVTTPEKLPLEKLNEVIQKLGNYTALASVKHRSQDTQMNYCTDYTAHASTCDQANWRNCKRHLTKQEMDECTEMEKRLNPLLLKGIRYEISGLNISRGEIDQMRRILNCVRAAIQ